MCDRFIIKALEDYLVKNYYAGLINPNKKCGCFRGNIALWCNSIPKECIGAIEHSFDYGETPYGIALIQSEEYIKKRANLKCKECERLFTVDLNKAYEFVFCPTCSGGEKKVVLDLLRVK